MESPTPQLLAQARVFTIAFALLTAIGVGISVAIPMVVPGPKLLTIPLGSCTFFLVVVLGARLLPRILIRRASRVG